MRDLPRPASPETSTTCPSEALARYVTETYAKQLDDSAGAKSELIGKQQINNPHGAGEGWVRTLYPDGRDMAGILSTQAFYVRYRSTAFNYNRDRANAVSRGLLCHDYLDGDVRLDTSINLADPAVVATAVVKDPACAACHQTLDPLASYFFPYFRGVLPQPLAYPMELYDPTQVSTGWFLTNDRPPSYFGQDVVGIAGLGQAIANDPRFARCAKSRSVA